ncbi:hypothetical protein ACIBL8_38380 [Streptomyces sp. NPDC050523]|uniref:hypothetical protein n=1 Tax=Streptomyces sp. NPDC050523 TaxID=3365622 RepID=UPI00379B31C3
MIGVFSRGTKSSAQDEPFWKQRGWAAWATFLAGLLAMSVLSILTQDDTSNRPSNDLAVAAPGPLSPGSSAGGNRHPDSRPEGCRTDDSQTGKPTSEPSDVKWQRLNVTSVPTSASVGPLRYDGPLWWCFARTPMGAVLAAHIILSQMTGANWRTIAGQQLVPGPYRDSFVEQRSRFPDAEFEEKAKDGAIGKYVGFSVSSFTPDSAKVRLLISAPLAGYGTTTISLHWREGDWKVTPDKEGSLYSKMTSTVSTSGFVMWGV